MEERRKNQWTQLPRLKTFSILFVLLSCCFLTGCRIPIISDVKDSIAKYEMKENIKTLESSRGQPMTRASAELMDKADESRKKAMENIEKGKGAIWPISMFYNAKAGWDVKSAVNSEKKFSQAIKTDKVNQQYKQGLKDQKLTESKEQLKKLLPILFVFLLLGGGVVILMLLKKKKPAPQQAPVQDAAKRRTPIPQAKRTDQLTVNYDKLLVDICAKAGVSKDSALSAYGDSRKAWEKVNQMVLKGMSTADIEQKMQSAS